MNKSVQHEQILRTNIHTTTYKHTHWTTTTSDTVLLLTNFSTNFFHINQKTDITLEHGKNRFSKFKDQRKLSHC